MNPALNIVIALIILVFVLFVYLVFSVKNQLLEIKVAAYKLYFELTRKDDLLPLLIEKLSVYAGRDFFNDLIENRSNTAKITIINSNKKTMEDDLWLLFENKLQSISKQADITKDINIKYLLEETKKADQKINEAMDFYNSLAKRVNKLLVFPITLLVNNTKIQLYK